MENRKPVCVASFSVLVAIVACIIAIVAVVEVKNRSDPKDDGVSKSPICLKCETLPLSNESAAEFGIFRDGVGHCCVDNIESVLGLLKFMLQAISAQRQAALPTYNISDFSFSPVSAHKRLLPSVEYDLTDETVPVFGENPIPLHLDSFIADDFLEHNRGVDVFQSGLGIIQDGLYYVYSNIRYNPDSSKPCGDYAKQTWEHRIMRKRANPMQESGTILKTEHTCCDKCVREKSTSFTGGVFYLEKGDRLTTDVSGYALIRFDGTASYIGLYMLGAGTQDGQT